MIHALQRRTWLLVALAFGVLITAVVASGIALYRDYRRIYREIEVIQQSYRMRQDLLNGIRSELYSMAILVRDYLLNTSPSVGREQREQLLQFRNSLLSHVAELERAVGAVEGEQLTELGEVAREYSAMMDSIFEWTPEEIRFRSYRFLTREILPFRNKVLDTAADVAQLHAAQLQLRQSEIRALQGEAERFMTVTMLFVSGFGLLVAALVVWRTKRLEDQSEAHQAELEAERSELRRLSNRIVSAQEEERKAISRELHDEIGQLLTGMKIELLHLEESCGAPRDQFANHMKRARSMAEETLRSVRDLATGLRPAVLDQLGLEPAVRWQAREHTRLTGVPVAVVVDGSIDDLPDTHRTCAYRAVQEALTNCARHANPRSIRICIHGSDDALSLTVQDDGRGFVFDRAGDQGLGLLGMEERVAELGGSLKVSSQPEKGTAIDIHLPIQRSAPV
jgi:signal transduction histidine kinase